MLILLWKEPLKALPGFERPPSGPQIQSEGSQMQEEP
jgi:hypothetical protein